jgi:WD40 repeat protein
LTFKKDIKLCQFNDSIFEIILKGHDALVICLLYFQDDFLLSGSADSSIKVWNTTDSTLIETLKSHSQAVLCLVKLSENRVASSSDDTTIKIWQFGDMPNKTGQTREIITLNGHSNPIRTLFYYGYKNYLVSSEWNSFIFIWDLNNFALKAKLNAYNSVCSLIYFSNEYLISGSSNGFIQIWSLASFIEIKSYFRDSAAVSSFALLSEKRLVVGFANGKIEVLNFIY